MSSLALIVLASGGSDVSAGAWMTLVLPIAFTVVMLAVWFVAARRRRDD